LVEEDFLLEGSCVGEEPFPVGTNGSVWLDEDSGVIDETIDGAILAGHPEDEVAFVGFRDLFQLLDGGPVERLGKVSELVFAAVPREEVLAEDVEVRLGFLDIVLHGLDVFLFVGYRGSCGNQGKSHDMASGFGNSCDDLRIVGSKTVFFLKTRKNTKKRENYIYLPI